MKRRGAFKTPGGKLIAAEFEVRDDILRDVVVTGDFFLYPEDALPVLARGLEGLPATLSQAEYAEHIRAAVPADVELLGASPEALATAVIRALRDPEAEA